MDAINLVQSIIDAVETIKQDMDTMNQRIKQCDTEISDLLHDIEFSKFNACEGYYYAKELQELRRKRREYKEYEEHLDLLRGSMNKYKWITSDLKNNIKAIRNKKDQQIHRQYTPRIRTDLKMCKLEIVK